MIGEMDGLITIGEFAARCRLSPKVLRTYADVGLLVPSAVDPASAYRYYDTEQLAEAAIVALLRRAGVPVADIARFLTAPSGEALDGWERSLRAEVHARRDALAEVRARLGIGLARTRGVTMVEIRSVEDREELRRAFDLAGAQLPERLNSSDFRFGDLDAHFPDDRPMMLLAIAEGRAVGAAVAFRNDDGWVTLRIIGIVEISDTEGSLDGWSRGSSLRPACWAWRASASAPTKPWASGSTSATHRTCSSSGSTTGTRTNRSHGPC